MATNNLTAIINGRRIQAIPPGGVYGADLLRELKPGSDRRGVIQRGGFQFETIEPQRRYSKAELLDKKGQGVKVGTMPDRGKGAPSFGVRRSQMSHQIITEQVIDVATHLFVRGVQFDEDNADWLVVPGYVLPRNWHHIAKRTDLLIAFPTEYPQLPPVGFYLMANLPSANGHVYDNTYHEAWQEPVRKGWRWYCCYIKPGAWQPAPVRRPGDWRYGDNLWTYFTLVNEVLASSD